MPHRVSIDSLDNDLLEKTFARIDVLPRCAAACPMPEKRGPAENRARRRLRCSAGGGWRRQRLHAGGRCRRLPPCWLAPQRPPRSHPALAAPARIKVLPLVCRRFYAVLQRPGDCWRCVGFTAPRGLAAVGGVADGQRQRLLRFLSWALPRAPGIHDLRIDFFLHFFNTDDQGGRRWIVGAAQAQRGGCWRVWALQLPPHPPIPACLPRGSSWCLPPCTAQLACPRCVQAAGQRFDRRHPPPAARCAQRLRGRAARGSCWALRRAACATWSSERTGTLPWERCCRGRRRRV